MTLEVTPRFAEGADPQDVRAFGHKRGLRAAGYFVRQLRAAGLLEFCA
jgi:hypothetical protein